MDILIIKIMGMAFPQPFAVEIAFLNTKICGNAPFTF